MIFHHIYKRLPEGRRTGDFEVGLRSLCRKTLNKDSIVIEIGCASGGGTIIFAEYCKLVYAIDPWEKCFVFKGFIDKQKAEKMYNLYLAELAFDQKTKPFGNIIKIKNKSQNCADLFENKSIDLVYIDSIHTHDDVVNTIEQYEPKVKDDKFISGHDYCKSWPQVVAAVKKIYSKPDMRFQDTSWVIKLTTNRRRYATPNICITPTKI